MRKIKLRLALDRPIGVFSFHVSLFVYYSVFRSILGDTIHDSLFIVFSVVSFRHIAGVRIQMVFYRFRDSSYSSGGFARYSPICRMAFVRTGKVSSAALSEYRIFFAV